MNTVDVLDFHNPQKYGTDMTPAVLAALERCRRVEKPLLAFPPQGTCHFWPDHAYEHHYCISNNDLGLKKIAFPLLDFCNLTVDGNGSEFIFHGRISPFVIDGSRGIIIKNLSIDYDRPFFTQALIIDADHTHVDLKIDQEEFPYRVEDGKIVFYGTNWESEEQVIMLMTEFDPSTKAPAYQQGIYLAKFPQSTQALEGMLGSMTKVINAEERPDGVVRLSAELDVIHKPGNMLTIAHENRYNSGFFMQNSKNVEIESVIIYHASAMGIIAQLCKDIRIKRLHIRLRKGSSRFVSTNADATHFVHCTGLIEMEECVFENMLDDATNVHGICTTVSQLLSEDTFEVELRYFMQHGINFYKPGDEISFINRKTLLPLHTAVVKDAVLIDLQHIRITVAGDLEGKVKENDAVDNFSRMPDVTIKKCRTGWNRPRGFLLTTPGKTVIEENVFYNSHCAIHINGDANYWFESGAVRNLLIRNNRFLDCCYASSGHVIVISPEIEQLEEKSDSYHHNIVIENNDFETYGTGLLNARSVDGLRFVGNRYRQTQSYKPNDLNEQQVVLQACRNFKIEQA